VGDAALDLSQGGDPVVLDLVEGGELRQDYDPSTMCVVLPIPESIAAGFPADEQRGEPHVTMVYIGSGSEAEFETVIKLAAEALALLTGEQVELGEPSHGQLGSGDQQVVYANANVSDEVVGIRDALVESVKRAGITVKHRDGPWLPHATVAYCELGSEFEGAMPTGSWPIDKLEVWRGDTHAVVSATGVERRQIGERSDAAAEAADPKPAPRAPAVHTLSRNLIEVVRVDRATVIRLDSVDYTDKLVGGLEPARKLDNGWWKIPTLYSVGGNIQSYFEDGREIREFRPYEEVTHPRSLASGVGIPWELRHSPALLTPDSVRGVAQGCVLEVWAHPDGIHTCGHSIAWGGELLDSISGPYPEAGDVSLAFRAQLDRRPGTNDYGEKFDRRQLMPIWNSKASEPQGRAGSARVLTPDRMDAAGPVITSAAQMLAFARRSKSFSPIPFDRSNWSRFDSAPLPEATHMNPIIQALLDQAKLTPTDLAAMLGIAEADLGKMLMGEAEMPAELMAKFMSALKGGEAAPAAAPAQAAAPPAQDGGGKVSIGGKDFEVPPEVAAHIAMLTEKAEIAVEKADRAETSKIAVVTKLTALESSQTELVPRADAERMSAERAMAYAEVIMLARQTNGTTIVEGNVVEFTPEPRKDAAGVELPLTIRDWELAAIRGAYGDDAPAIIERIDAADPLAQGTIIAMRIEDARKGLTANRAHTHEQQQASIARMRAANERQDAARAAGTDELQAAKDAAVKAGQNVIGQGG
jgi:2'-5' RNA ligase